MVSVRKIKSKLSLCRIKLHKPRSRLVPKQRHVGRTQTIVAQEAAVDAAGRRRVPRPAVGAEERVPKSARGRVHFSPHTHASAGARACGRYPIPAWTTTPDGMSSDMGAPGVDCRTEQGSPLARLSSTRCVRVILSWCTWRGEGQRRRPRLRAAGPAPNRVG